METAYTVYIRGCVKTFMSYGAGYPYVKCTKYTRNSMWSGFGALVLIKGDLSVTPLNYFEDKSVLPIPSSPETLRQIWRRR